MKEYYKDPQATKASFTDEGWLRTGDVGEIDSQSRVKIHGRISENFKNQKGEFIQPTSIEKKFSTNELVDHLCLVGKELEGNVMVVSLTDDARSKTADEVKNSLRKTMLSTNGVLRSYEKISRALIVKDAWTPENNFLTPTLKVKRREVESRYKDMIHQAAKQSDAIAWH